jgi:hypothetical protein
MQLNATNVQIRERTSWIAVDQITQVIDPKSRMQRLAYWIASKAKLFQPYIYKEPRITRKTVAIEGDILERISKAVLEFMKHYHDVDPSRDLVILFGNDQHRDLMGMDAVRVQTSLEFGRDGYRFRGIEVRAVGYLDGVLVLRRKDISGA